MILRDFMVDETRIRAMASMMDDYGIVEDASAEWPNNTLSKRTVVFADGTFARRGETPSFSVDSEELARCLKISADAKAIVGEMPVGLCSETNDPFLPFFIAADTRAPPSARIEASLVRARFGGTLFPAFSIKAEALAETTGWWQEVENQAASYEDDDGVAVPGTVATWRALVAALKGDDALVETAFVTIGTYEESSETDAAVWPEGTIMAPSILPRLVVGLTRAGSLVGLLGWSVMT